MLGRLIFSERPLTMITQHLRSCPRLNPSTPSHVENLLTTLANKNSLQAPNYLILAILIRTKAFLHLWEVHFLLHFLVSNPLRELREREHALTPTVQTVLTVLASDASRNISPASDGFGCLDGNGTQEPVPPLYRPVFTTYLTPPPLPNPPLPSPRCTGTQQKSALSRWRPYPAYPDELSLGSFKMGHDIT